MEVAAAPAGQQGEAPRARNRWKSATLSLQLWAQGAPREAQRPRRAAPKPWGRRLPPIPSAGQGRFALRTCWGPQPLPYGM
eukprot:6549314-Alexandrium_andersonii.AAC.1